MMTAELAIEYYGVRRGTEEGTIALTRNVPTNQADLDALGAEMRRLKPEILAHFDEIDRAAEERRAKIAAIEGLKEIEDAENAWYAYHRAYSKAFDSECVRLPKRPEVSVKELKEKYPRAAAYLYVQQFSNAANYQKSGIGSKHLERIINGEDYTKVIEDMEAEWTAAANEHLWD